VDLTISRPIKILALVAIMLAAGGGAMLTLSRAKQAPATPVVVEPSTPTVTTTSTTPATPTATKHAAATKPAGTRTAPPTSVAPATAAKTSDSAVGDNGLPTMLDDAFHKHAIVVVSVFDPQSETDAVSYAEAKAGASDARVGFVGVDLLDSTVAGALTTSLPGGGLLPEPGVLIYRRPGTLVERLDGFNDRDVVAQAAVASVSAPPMTAAGSASSGTATSAP
jgi:hypothetical protein